MTSPVPRSRLARLGEVSLWAGACGVVLAAHLAAATVLLQEEPEETGDLSPPAAIMIELAAEPEAAVTDDTVISEQIQDAQEVKTDQQEPVEQADVEPEPQPPVETAQAEPDPEPQPVEEPAPEMTQTIPEEPEPVEKPAEEQLAMLEHVEVPLPVVRPPPVEDKPEAAEKEEPKKKVVERRKPKPQPPESKAAVQAKADVNQANRTAAAATSSSTGGSSISPARWQSKLAAHLARQRGKCPAAGRSSTAYVTFRIDDSGNLSGVSLSRSSGYSDFDRYMVDLVRRASPVPPPPAGIGNKVTVPLGYKNC